MYNKEFEDMILEYDILSKAFDNVRLVDPIKKRVIDYKVKSSPDTCRNCFDFWGRNKVCDNCISIRAYHDNKTYYKMEYTVDEKIYIVAAIPVELPDRRAVMEILMNTTESLMLDLNNSSRYFELQELIDKMNNLALRDSLTGIYNRRYIDEKLPIDITNFALSAKPISIIMTDIDFFKRVNDTYGHMAGDRVLKQFAKLLTDCLKRGSDWAARYGGEEFLICLPGADQKYAAELAEIMRRKVEGSVFLYGEQEIRITASFGICIGTPEKELGMDELIEYADAKLYEAKSNGRNRVEA